MYWMVRSFYLELENTDLLNNFREATQTLWEKEAVLKELTKQVKLLEKLSNLQRERLDKVSANSSALVSFYNEVSSRQRQRGQEEKNDRSQMGSVEGLSERLTKRIGSIVMMCSARSNSAQEPTRLSRRGNKKPSTGYKPTTIEDKSDTFEERTTNQGTKPNSNPSPERAKGRRQTAKRHPRLSSHREENEASFSPRPSSPPPAPRSRGRNRSVSRLPSIQQRRNPRSRDISTQRSKTNEIPIRNTNELPPLVKERPRTKRGGTKSVELPELRQSERRRSPLESKE
ncbi:hypothetical protein BJ742DRAFT_831676 [Cladochytrium replicatum]|nr:hypothetical protein BJ742DRAFT_831676 [Cladochytrium replicatum]